MNFLHCKQRPKEFSTVQAGKKTISVYPEEKQYKLKMPKRNKGGRRNRGRLPRLVIDNFTFSTIQGNVSTVPRSLLSSLPPSSNFRPLWFEVEVCGYQPGSTSTSGWLAPVGCQIGFRSEADGTYTSNSRLMLAGATPKRLRVYYPRSADWYPWNLASSTTIADITAVCVGPTVDSNTKGYLRGIGRIAFHVQEESVTAACPSIGDVIYEPSPCSSLVLS